MGKTANHLTRDIEKYIQFVSTQIPIEKIILFGSVAKGTATKDSDIDLAIISSEFGKAPLKEKMQLYEWRYDADIQDDLQPFPFGTVEFRNSDDFFIKEIKNTGIDITEDVL